MATNRKLKAVTTTQESEAEALTSDYIDFQSLEQGLSDIRAKLGIEGAADETCHVSKLLPAGTMGVEPKVWIGDPENYDLEAIAKKHGSGEYRVMVYMKIPDGHKVRQINKIVAWQLSAEDEARLEAAREAAKHPPEPKPQDMSATAMQMLAQTMAQGFQGLGELIVKATSKPDVDPMANLEKTAQVLRTLMPAQPAHNPQSDFMGMLNMVKLFNEATGAGKASIPEGSDPSTALMLAGMDMFKPVLSKALEQKQAAQSQPLPPNGATVALPPSAQPIEPEAEDFMLFKLQLKAANKAAAKGANPAEFADTIYSILPDEVLHGMATDPAWFSYLVKAVPECEAYKAWYEEVHTALLDIAVEEGIFIRGENGLLTLAAEAAQNDATDNKAAPDAAGNATPSTN